MKRLVYIAVFVLLLGLLTLSACMGGKHPSETTADSTQEGDSQSDRGTTESTESTTAGSTTPEIGGKLEIKSAKLDADGWHITFCATQIVSEQSEEDLRLTLTGDKISPDTHTVRVKQGVVSTLTVPQATSEVGGEITLTLELCSNGSVGDTAVLRVRDNVIQLTEAGIPLLLQAMTAEEKALLTVGDWGDVTPFSGKTQVMEKYGIPAVVFSDGPNGVRTNQDTVWYPSCSMLAATWNRDIAANIGKQIGEDAIAVGVDVMLGAGMNIQRTVLGGRNFEYFSEDAYLSGKMAASYTLGMQSTGVGVSLKHYAVNNQETSRSTVSANLTERALREVYLRGFGYAVRESQPMTIMSSYNQVNGTYSSTNKDLLDILHIEFGYDGLVVSDWDASGSQTDRVNAGNDLSQRGSAAHYADICASIQSGTLSEEALNQAAEHVLRLVCRSYRYLHSGEKINSKIQYREQRADALAAAQEAIVLLKNENQTLPMQGKKVALFGNGSYDTVYGGDGSGYVSSSACVSISAGIRKAGYTLLSELNTAYRSAKVTEAQVTVTDAECAKYAKSADIAVLTLSRKTAEGVDHTNTKGDYLLSDEEYALISRVSAAFHAQNKKLVVLINTGNPIETASWEEMADAILYVGLTGEQTGTAIASVLSGEVNPSGKLTQTWPIAYADAPYAETFPGSAASVTYNDDIYVGYAYYTTFGVKTAYSFGYGLSYTDFTYSDFAFVGNSQLYVAEDTLTFSVKVTNTGAVAGKEVVELYVSKPDGKNEQPAYLLCGFAKTELLQPNQSQTMEIVVSTEDLATYLTDSADWVLEVGTYTFTVAASVTDARATLYLSVQKQILVADVENRCVPTQTITVVDKTHPYVPITPEDSLTKGATISANGDEGGQYPAQNAIDGDGGTRWSGAGAVGDKMLTLDLGAEYTLGKMYIRWESNNAYKYRIEYSSDGIAYTTYRDVTMTAWETDDFDLDGLQARYIRLVIPASAGWCSIYEWTVFEKK